MCGVCGVDVAREKGCGDGDVGIDDDEDAGYWRGVLVRCALASAAGTLQTTIILHCELQHKTTKNVKQTNDHGGRSASD